MDTDALKAFVAINDNQSFTLAAEQLHITQPAISKRINALESQLDTQLFDRIGRDIRLTEAGKQLLPIALRILDDLNEAKRSIKALNEGVTGELSLGISHHIGLHRLPPVLKKFSKAYPEVHLDIEFMDSEEAYHAVLHGQLDIGVITLEPDAQTHNKGLFRETIWLDQLKVIVAKDHELAKEKTISLTRLNQYNAILPGLNTYTGQIVANLFKENHLILPTSMSTNYLETIKMMVEIGLGWSVLPVSMLDEKLTAIEIKNHQLERQLGYVYHSKRSLSNAAKAFITALKEHKVANKN